MRPRGRVSRHASMSPRVRSVLRSIYSHITLATVDRTPKPVLASVRRRDPEAFDPGGLMSYMLGVATLQVCHPVSLLVLMQGDDQALHTVTSAAEVLAL
jgi:hypothetical protein